MNFIGPVGIAFWIFMSVATVAGIVAEYKKRRLDLEPLRTAIERGQQLDPAIIERLMAHERHEQPINPLHLRIGGIITIASGFGLGILAVLVAQMVPIALYPMLGVGGLAICVGLGLLFAARVVENQARLRGSNTSGASGPGA